jgi:hypothetical protein
MGLSMNPQSLAAAVVVSLSCVVVTASCVQEADGAGGGAPASTPDQPAEPADQADAAPEPIGEAQEDWTRDECYAMWHHNCAQCTQSDAHLRYVCWAACATWLGVCLKTATE